jgi:predicted nucleic acid-binding protein
MLVIDASLAVELSLHTPKGAHAAEIALQSGEELHAPHLIDIEFAHALRRLVLSNEIEGAAGMQALQDFEDLRLDRHPHSVFLPRIWELRNSVSAYDGAYIALSEILHAPLLTCDGRLSRSHGHRAEIRIIA